MLRRAQTTALLLGAFLLFSQFWVAVHAAETLHDEQEDRHAHHAECLICIADGHVALEPDDTFAFLPIPIASSCNWASTDLISQTVVFRSIRAPPTSPRSC